MQTIYSSLPWLDNNTLFQGKENKTEDTEDQNSLSNNKQKFQEIFKERYIDVDNVDIKVIYCLLFDGD